MNAPTSPSFAQCVSSSQASSTSSTLSMAMPLRRSEWDLQNSAIQPLYTRQMAESMAPSGMRYQKRPWLGCRHAPHTPSISFSLIIACGSYAPSLTSSHRPRKSIWDGSSNRWPACMTAPSAPTCWPSMNHASYLRPVGVSIRSIRGARSLNLGSIRLAYRSGGSMMWESAEMSLYVAIAPSSVNRSGHSCTRRLSPCPPPARGHGTPVGPRCQKAPARGRVAGQAADHAHGVGAIHLDPDQPGQGGLRPRPAAGGADPNP